MADRPTVTTLSAGARYNTSTLNDNFTALRDHFDTVIGIQGNSGDNNIWTGDHDAGNYDLNNLGRLYCTSLSINGTVVTGVGADGDVPAPANPGDDNKALIASGGTWSWSAIPAPATTALDIDGTTSATPTTSDTVLIYDDDAGTNKKATLADVVALSGVSDATTLWTVGDIKLSFKSSITGFLALDGTSVGNASSSADNASADYEDLFAFLWDNLADAQAAVSGGRGASAAADWAANKRITMPDARGRMPIGAGTGSGLTARTVGDTGGSEDAITVSHTHGVGTYATASGGGHTHTVGIGGEGTTSGSVDAGDGTSSSTIATSSAGAHTHTLSGSSASSGSSGTDANSGPWLAYHVHIKY